MNKKVPNSKFQAPKKLQTLSLQVWLLKFKRVFGVRDFFGTWNLEFGTF